MRALALLLMIVCFPAYAAGDAEAGRAKAAICASCHGQDGNSANPQFPKLAGQLENYIFKVTMDFKAGTRKDDIMSAMVNTIPDTADLQDIAAYYASLPVMQGGEVDAELAAKGQEIYQRDKCRLCHGDDGRSLSGMGSPPPFVGGQHHAYLAKAMKEIRDGMRRGDVYGLMNKTLKRMTDDEIEALAAYMHSL